MFPADINVCKVPEADIAANPRHNLFEPAHGKARLWPELLLL
jgi:hypothetical protein